MDLAGSENVKQSAVSGQRLAEAGAINKSLSTLTLVIGQLSTGSTYVSPVFFSGLAETFPSFPVSGPFLPDVPGFQVPPDSIFPHQLRSSFRALPLHLHFENCSDVFCFTSCFDVPEPFQLSPSHNHRYIFIISFNRCSNLLTPLPIAPFSSLLLPYTFNL